MHACSAFIVIVVVLGSFLHCLENLTDVNIYLYCTPPLKLFTVAD